MEIGRITELAMSSSKSPAVLFDNIKGYKSGYRVISNVLNSPRRIALALGLPMPDKEMDLVNAWRHHSKEGIRRIPPVEINNGPVKENVQVGDSVDLFEFPIPKWHDLDGGRYIGTGDMVIQRDPDGGWVNCGTYRVQAQDKSTVTLHITANHHGSWIAKKYWAKGLSCPVAIVCGQDPLLWTASTSDLEAEFSEYDYAGWLRNEPIEVVR